MSNSAFKKIKAGLDDARAYLDKTADKRQYCVHVFDKLTIRHPEVRARNARASKDRRP